MTTDSNNKPDKDAYKASASEKVCCCCNKESADENEVKALEESVRLGEKQIEELGNSILILERKAVLLVTSCVVIIGYLLSAEVELMPQCNCHSPFEPIRIISLVILSLATFLGGSVVDLAGVGMTGLTPNVSKFILENYKSEALTTMYEHVLTKYGERIIKTNQTAEQKAKKLKIAKWMLVTGLIGATIWQIGNFY